MRHSENVYLNDMWINELMIGRCLIRLSDCQRKENEQMRCFEEPLISASESVTKGSSWYAIASKVGVADTAFLKKNEYFHWMNNQIIFSMNKFFEWIFLPYYWMNKFFEWIFLPYYWMNFWMNQKSAIFIRKMNKKCVLRKKLPILHVFHCFLKLRLFFQFEWIFLIQFWIE